MKKSLLWKITGLTLIEMLLVLGLISILSLVGNQQWQHRQSKQRLMIASQQLLTFLAGVQQHADRHNQSYFFYSVKQGTSWRIIARNKLAMVTSSLINTDWSYQPPYNDIALLTPSMRLEFHGRRNQAMAGHLVLANQAGKVRIILSTRGRLRRCVEQPGHHPVKQSDSFTNTKPAYLSAGIAPCE